MVRSIAKQCVSNHEAGVRAACILRDAAARLLRMRRINNRVNLTISPDPNFKQPRLHFGRMSGRRTGVHPFAWTCSAILAAEFRASVRWISLVLPQKRERSAVRRNCLERAPAREHVPILRDQLALRRSTAMFRRWDPSASPTCHGYYPMALGRRRDGRFHPRLLSEPGGLLHTSPGTRFARPCARAPHPIHAQIALQSAPQRMGISPRY